MEEQFIQIIRSVEDEYREDCAMILLQTASEHQIPLVIFTPLVQDLRTPKSYMRLTNDSINNTRKNMAQYLQARCKGLIEVLRIDFCPYEFSGFKLSNLGIKCWKQIEERHLSRLAGMGLTFHHRSVLDALWLPLINQHI